MSRILGLLVLLLAAILLLPPLRERARPQIEWALTPVYRWETKNRLSEIHRMMAREQATGSQLPRPRDFTRFLEQREGAGAAHDAWGEPYYLEVSRDSFLVVSSGPDRAQNTADDIRSRPYVAPEKR